MENWLQQSSDVIGRVMNFPILREYEIEIPFPQRDLHLRSGAFVLQPPSNNSRS